MKKLLQITDEKTGEIVGKFDKEKYLIFSSGGDLSILDRTTKKPLYTFRLFQYSHKWITEED